MKRLDRLNAILIQLQSKRVVKSAEIAGRFDISQRTVYRDIRALEEAGIPIGAEAGTGYFLMENFQLPPIMFTNEEASAILLGEKLVEKMSDEQIRKHYQSAAFKIKAVLKPTDKDYLEELHDKVLVYNWASVDGRSRQLYLSEIQKALVNKQVLEICYQKKNSMENSLREVEPIGLCNYGSHWHLFAWCRERSDYRDFRLDRIKSLRGTEKQYMEKQHISIDEFIGRMIVSGDHANITIRISPERKKNIDDSKYYYGFTEEENIDGVFCLKFMNTDLQGFASWLISSRSLAKVVEPPELQNILDLYIDELLQPRSQKSLE
ncbi:MAG: hypothetical protein A2W90_22320 [Bacteroidetes bacterium GWF2_42_66]|nr:MAG: hypothetical protein A2W92_13735 [Bacteroidetes bacterium GWA2_42_15]OFY02221.1 MAG: hypothetical protein A2W89_11440 [Bacteroidetes bacterium GWE2_42_39]OFY43667.1 MAG: hypothetical protein A2W90_22320 [Bacteroidetes bacterium GWF2_42_66]